jgi:hypothetical protein
MNQFANNGLITPLEAIKMTKFFTDEFVSYLAEYKYVMRELFSESVEFSPLEIQVPFICSPLSAAISLQ